MQTASDPIRAFVALALPAELKGSLAGLLRKLDAALPPRAVRWVAPEQFHLTLKFFGDLPAEAVPAVTQALERATSGVSPFTLHLIAPGCFPKPQAPRVLWLGLGGELESLRVLQEAVLRQTAAWGETETRGFQPHLTLGRVKTSRPGDLRAIGQAISDIKPPPPCAWQVAEVLLMQSRLSPGGAIHSCLAKLPLRP